MEIRASTEAHRDSVGPDLPKQHKHLLHFTGGSALNGIPFNSMGGFKELLMPLAAKSTGALRGPTSTTTTTKKTLQKQTKHNYSVSGDAIM